MFSAQFSDVTYTCRIKTYPCGGREIMACTKPIFKPDGWEERDKAQPHKRDSIPSEDDARAIRRARAAVRDIAMSNPMSFFVTLTLDPLRIDRYDPAAVIHRLNGWLSNRVQRHGLKYVLVPERHKDGAVHFHGFFNDALPMMDSGTVRLAGGGKPRKPRSVSQREKWLSEGGAVVYNIPGWSFGFSTALPLWGEYSQAVSYVLKYIGKDMQGRIGGRWYYSGGALDRPEVEYIDLDFREVAAMPGAYQFTVEGAAAAFVIVREAI